MIIRKKTILLSLVLLLNLSVLWAQEHSFFTHTVSKGQTLYSISNMYQVSVPDIVAMNPGCDKVLPIGQKLRIPQAGVADNEIAANETMDAQSRTVKSFHTIKAKETLYGLTQLYKVSARAICDANPGLNEHNFKIGQVIVVPPYNSQDSEAPALVSESVEASPRIKAGDCKVKHTVAKGETVYYITHLYNITQQELFDANPQIKKGKLKKKMVLCIPYTEKDLAKVEEKVAEPTDSELFSENRDEMLPLNSLKAAVVLPFMLDGEHSTGQEKMVEYYQGVLMAVDSLKRLGFSMELYAFDAGGEGHSLAPLLSQKEMSEMNIIFGSFYPSQTRELAEFAKRHDIHLVVPFTQKDEAVFSNHKVFLVNTPQSYFYPEVYEHFTRSFPDCRVVFLGDSIDESKREFIHGFKAELDAKQIPYSTVGLDALAPPSNDGKDVEVQPYGQLRALVKDNGQTFFVPLSSSSAMLNNVLPHLLLVVRDTLFAQCDIHLFGYPEWQLHVGDHLAEFYEVDTYFYTSFYTNNLLSEAVKFGNDFFKWYNRDMMNNYPKYGMLGFDTAYFFLLALQRYGANFDDMVGNFKVKPIQTGFKFERVNNWGGFINKKVFFVHFSRYYELSKIDFDR